MYEKIKSFFIPANRDTGDEMERKVFTTIRVRGETVKRLKSLKLYTDRNLSDTLERILSEYEAQRK